MTDTAFRPLMAYDSDGQFTGYLIQKVGTLKISGSNLYSHAEGPALKERLESLNETASINASWPDINDPEVQNLVADESFEPIEYEDDEVIDAEASNLVFTVIDGEEQINEKKSRIVYKTIQVPKDPSAVAQRLRSAAEKVARQRAGLDD